MAGKLSKSDYEKALSAEWGFPVFLKDEEYERLSASKPLSKPSGPYQDPFAYLDDAKAQKASDERYRKSKPGAWTTAPGKTYKTENPQYAQNLRDNATLYNDMMKAGTPSAGATANPGSVGAAPVLAGVPSPNASAKKPEAPGSASIGKVSANSPTDMTYAKGTPLTAATSMPVGVEYLNGVDPNPYVEDLGGDDRPNSLEQKIADQKQYEMLMAADQIGALPTTYKQNYIAPKPAPLPTFTTDEDVDARLNAKYAALMAGQ